MEGWRSSVTRNPPYAGLSSMLSTDGKGTSLCRMPALKVGSCDGFGYEPRQNRKVATVSRLDASCEATWLEPMSDRVPLTPGELAARPLSVKREVPMTEFQHPIKHQDPTRARYGGSDDI